MAVGHGADADQIEPTGRQQLAIVGRLVWHVEIARHLGRPRRVEVTDGDNLNPVQLAVLFQMHPPLDTAADYAHPHGHLTPPTHSAPRRQRQRRSAATRAQEMGRSHLTTLPGGAIL
jgi:hypothetical protein